MRALLIAGLTLGLLAPQAQAGEQTVSHETVPQVTTRSTYSRVRGNPRRPQPIKSIQEAIYLACTDEGVRNDVVFRLKSGLPRQYWYIYDQGLAPAFYAKVRTAYAHHHLSGSCPIDGENCRVQQELENDVLRLAIPRGTVYSAVTEGNGKTRHNRVFAPKNGKTYYAMRVYTRGVKIKEQDGYILKVDTFFDLIFECGNMALGEVRLAHIQQGKVEQPRIEYRDRIVTREVMVQPGASYTPPERSSTRAWQYNAGNVGVQPIQRIDVDNRTKVENVFKDLIKIINENININQNMNNIAVSNANGGEGGGKH
jgi:hypothetical protein